MPLKLGSNWKACGVGVDMRRMSPGNGRVSIEFPVAIIIRCFVDRFWVLQRG